MTPISSASNGAARPHAPRSGGHSALLADILDEQPGFAYRLSCATLIAMGLSVVLHACLLLIAAAITTGGGGGGGGRGGAIAPPVEVALLDDTALTSLNDGPASLEVPGVEDVKGSVDLAPMPVVETPGGSGLTDSGDLGQIGTGMGGAGDGAGIGIGPGSGGAGAGGTSFFGVESRGSRFAFIVDVSGSMDGEKMDALKRELIKAIDRLTENSSFVVLPFESDVRPLGGVGRLTPASSKNKKSAMDAINLLRAEGGTQPAGAFHLALRARPRPDAIYFMTDGLFSDDVVDEIKADLRNGRNVPIHCIAFMDKSSEPLMRKIAEMSDGSYTYVEGPRR